MVLLGCCYKVAVVFQVVAMVLLLGCHHMVPMLLLGCWCMVAIVFQVVAMVLLGSWLYGCYGIPGSCYGVAMVSKMVALVLLVCHYMLPMVLLGCWYKVAMVCQVVAMVLLLGCWYMLAMVFQVVNMVLLGCGYIVAMCPSGLLWCYLVHMGLLGCCMLLLSQVVTRYCL